MYKRQNKTFIPHSSVPTGTTSAPNNCQKLSDDYGMYASGTGQGIFSPKINQLWVTNKCKDITDNSVCQKISNSMGTYPGQWANIWPGKNKKWPTHQKTANLWVKNRCNTKPWWRHPPNIQEKMGKPSGNMCHYLSNIFGTYPGNWRDLHPYGPWKYWVDKRIYPQWGLGDINCNTRP